MFILNRSGTARKEEFFAKKRNWSHSSRFFSFSVKFWPGRKGGTIRTRKVHYILLIFSITTLLCVTPRLSYKPKTEPPLEPAKLPSEAQILPALVPSHSNLMSSDKNLTLPNSAAFSQPNKLSGNLQEPSVTVLDLAKLAEEVIARFLSFISLFASEEANKSSVKPACACITGLDKVTTTAAAKAADLLKETFFCAEAVGFAAACVCVCVSFVSVLFHLHTLCVVAAEQQTRFFSSLLSLGLVGEEKRRGRTKKKREEEARRKENDRVCAKAHRGTFSSLSLSLSSLFPYLNSSIRAYHEGGRRTSASGQTR